MAFIKTHTDEYNITIIKNISRVFFYLTLVMFVIVATGVLSVPKADSHFLFKEDTGQVFGADVDVGLHDTWFFQWHRAHINIHMLEINLMPLAFQVFDVSPIAEGEYLNTYPLVLTIISGVVLAANLVLLGLNFVLVKETKFSLLYCGATLSLGAILALGLALKSPDVLNMAMAINMDTRTADGDIQAYIKNFIENGINPDEVSKRAWLANYEMQSVVPGYASGGYIAAGVFGCIGGLLAYGSIEYTISLLKINSPK